MGEFYGVRVTEKQTALTAPVTAPTGALAFGTAPVHQVGGSVNQVVRCDSFEEAVAAFGWSEDYEKYPLCEMMDVYFKQYGVAPLLLVNVMDPAKNQGEVKTEKLEVASGQVILSGDVLAETLEVKDDTATTTYTKGTDYDVFYEDGNCIVEVLTAGSIPTSTSQLSLSYKEITIAAGGMTEKVLGGHNTRTGEITGVELADRAYFQTGVLPSVLLAPGTSQDSRVAAVLAAKAQELSVVFRSFAVCDMEADGYEQVVETKEKTSANRQVKERVCWPMLTRDGKTYHMSTHVASLMCLLAAEDGGIPSEPASNKTLQADGAVLADGKEITLDLTQANYLRGKGITTALNFVNGLTTWGEYCACSPENTDPKDRFCNVAMMVNYIANTVILTFWSYIDEKMTPRLAASICDKINYWLNGLKSGDHLLGARCEVLEEENPVEDLCAGIVRVHIYLAVPAPAQQIDFIVEYDTSYVSAAFGVSE